jgi:hypothetical protein
MNLDTPASLGPDDAQVALRVLRGALGVVDAGLATGALDLAALGSLLPPLGLGHAAGDHRALFQALGLPDGGFVQSVSSLPWSGPPRLVAQTLCVSGRSALVEVCLRLAAGSLLGRVAPRVAVDAAPPAAGAEVALLVARLGEGSSPVWLVAAPPQLVLDVVSPAARDLAPVLRVAAERAGMGRVPFTPEVGYHVLPLVEAASPALLDERVENDAAAGIWRAAGGLVMSLPAVDAGSADERLAAVLKEAEGLLVVVEPEFLRHVMPAVQARLRAILVLGPADLPPDVVADLPDRVVDTLHGHVAVGLLGEAGLQARDVAVEGTVRVGESAVTAPCGLLGGAARRAAADASASVLDVATADAVFAVSTARDTGGLPARCRVSVAAYAGARPVVGRALACAFLASNLGGPRPTSPGRSKVRIRG